ncbi:MAG: hypothetical protein OXE99_08885 [Cellvibrionales bacterium]|nr:hypothetical protein [Cellvibrionales bacterium]
MQGNAQNLVTIRNRLTVPLDVYSTVEKPVTDTHDLHPEDFEQHYTKIGSIPAEGSSEINLSVALARLVMARATDQFPVALWVPDILAPSGTQRFTVTEAMQSASNQAFAFYKHYIAEPYSPLSLQFNDILLNPANVQSLNHQIETFFNNTPYKGCSYFAFSIVSYWALNYVYAWPGTYYVYQKPQNQAGYVFPNTPTASITIANGQAIYQLEGEEEGQALTYTQGKLQSATLDIALTGIYRELAWENKPNTFGMCWMGKSSGAPLIAQPYAGPDTPWWVIGYDVTYTGYQGLQIYMMADMAVTLLEAIPGGLVALGKQSTALYNRLAQKFQNQNTSANFDPEDVEDLDPINIDIDVDVDVDVDTDIDVVQDTDVDVDVDVDIDVDVVFVDVDVDIDVDVDTVQDTDTDVDVDVDIDVDIDTDIDIPTGTVDSSLTKIGHWIMKKGFPFVVENLAIMFAFQTADKLLAIWRKAGEENLYNQAPEQASATGLLINYMLNTHNSIDTRWTTFADWVQQAEPSIDEQQMMVANILMTKNTAADSALKIWRWPVSDENDLVNQMVSAASQSDHYKAYLFLAQASDKQHPLPIKVGCGVATRFLTKIA